MRGYLTSSIGDPPSDAFRGHLTLTTNEISPYGFLTLTMNAGLAAALRPRGDTEQRVLIRVSAQLPAGLTKIWGSRIVSWTVTESTNGTTWTLVVPAHDETIQGAITRGDFKWETDYEGAAVPGSGAVQLELLYDLPDGTIVGYPLWCGYSLESPRTEDGAGHRLTMTGLGGWGYWGRTTAELNLEPNHGLTPGQMIVLMAQSAGVPDAQIKVGSFGPPRTNAFTLACAEWRGPAVELAAVFGQRLFWNRKMVPELRIRPIGGSPS